MGLNVVHFHQGLRSRVEFVERLDSGNVVIEKTVDLKLPLFMTLDVWKRHGYSLGDIQTTLEYFSSVHIWQCALMLGISPCSSAIKLSFASPESIVFSSKCIAIKKILRVLKQEGLFDEGVSVLDIARKDHIPPIPVHLVTDANYQLLDDMIPKKVDHFNPMFYPQVFEWSDIVMVPLWVEGDAIYATRVVAKEEFDRSRRHSGDIQATKPLDIRVGTADHVQSATMYCGVEEVCFFKTPRTTTNVHMVPKRDKK